MKISLSKRPIGLIVCFSLLISSLEILWAKELTRDDYHSPFHYDDHLSQEENLDSFYKSIDDLNKVFENPEKESPHPLDTFHLLSQKVDRSREEEITKIIQQLKEEDSDGENIEHFVDESVPRRNLFSKNLKVHVNKSSSDGEKIKILNQRDFKNSFAADYQKNDLSLDKNETFYFSIHNKKGELLHTFYRNDFILWKISRLH